MSWRGGWDPVEGTRTLRVISQVDHRMAMHPAHYLASRKRREGKASCATKDHVHRFTSSAEIISLSYRGRPRTRTQSRLERVQKRRASWNERT